jgi:Phage portal protein
MAILDRVKRMWNAFRFSEANEMYTSYDVGPFSTARPDRTRLRYTNERSIISSIYTRISVDLAAIEIRHIELDEQGRYLKDSESVLNECLMIEPNLDQGPRSFRRDIAMTLFDSGCAAIVPIDTSVDPNDSENFDILSLRVGYITSWYPERVRVSVYNVDKGRREEITLKKKYVAIVENPLYSVMNEPNSTLQRLIRKLNLLDIVDEQSSSGKLDLIIQLPYVVKTDARKIQAEKRRQDIEFQLKGSQYGIAYTDATEKITQLNRPAENNLLKQVEYLTNMLYGQLGLTEEVMNGTADEKAMLNYFNRTIEPIVAEIIEAMQRSFLRRSGFAGKERIKYFQNPFKLVPVKDLAEIADKFTRNEILSSNEIRGYMGIPPSSDPKADELVNSNMPQPVETDEGVFDEVNATLDSVFNELGVEE